MRDLRSIRPESIVASIAHYRKARLAQVCNRFVGRLLGPADHQPCIEDEGFADILAGFEDHADRRYEQNSLNALARFATSMGVGAQLIFNRLKRASSGVWSASRIPLSEKVAKSIG